MVTHYTENDTPVGLVTMVTQKNDTHIGLVAMVTQKNDTHVGLVTMVTQKNGTLAVRCATRKRTEQTL